MKNTSICPKTALITGAGKRIGREIALKLAQEGWDIAVHYHSSEEEAQALVALTQAMGRKSVAVQADLSDEASVKTLVGRVNAKLSPLTCLINNASVFENDTLATGSRESWDKHMEVNLRAPLVLIQDFAAQLPKEIAGNVINILDYAVWSLPHNFLSYIVSKSALWTLTQTLALTLAPQIRLNAIGPGPALANSRQSESGFSQAWHSAPLGRSTSAEEIGNAVRFILATPSMTGQMIALDGGRHLQGAEYV